MNKQDEVYRLRMLERREAYHKRVPGRLTPPHRFEVDEPAPNRHDRRIANAVARLNGRRIRKMKEAIARKLNCSVEEIEAKYGQST